MNFSVLQCATTEAATAAAALVCFSALQQRQILQMPPFTAVTSAAASAAAAAAALVCFSALQQRQLLQLLPFTAAAAATSSAAAAAATSAAAALVRYTARTKKNIFQIYIFFLTRALGYLNFWV